MEITNDDILLIEKQLLGTTFQFNEQQKNVIKFQRNGDFIACPGSGKTTVLIAKLAIIMRKMKKENTNQGVCIITFTNVAVEEILSNLKKVGISEVKYPHFIGTIHDFCNHFFSLKAYHSLNKDQKIDFLEEKEYLKKFQKLFLEVYAEPNYDVRYLPGSTTLSKIALKIKPNKTLSLIGLESKTVSHRTKLLNTLQDLFRNGNLCYEDTISLADWYISEHSIKIRAAFSKRFKYCFIDEAQDTSISQMNVISKITKDNPDIVVQKYGDPYQSLYNGELENGWDPDVEYSHQIALSNRFGEAIAHILRTTCVVAYPTLEGNPSIHSFKPHAFIYSDTTRYQVLAKYAEVIQNLSRTYPELPLKVGKICAVSSHHLAINKFFIGYEQEQKIKFNISQQKYCVYEFSKMLYILINKKSKGLNDFLKEFEELRNLPHSLNLRTTLSRWIKNIKNVEFTNTVDLKDQIIVWIKESYSIDISDMDVVEEIEVLEKKLYKVLTTKLISTEDTKNNILDFEDIQINLNTVHGVKGETHSATLFLESGLYRGTDVIGTDVIGTDISDILSYMSGEYDEDLRNNLLINKSLKLAYVALSRPKYFVGIAIDRANINASQVEKLKRNNWEVIEVQ